MNDKDSCYRFSIIYMEKRTIILFVEDGCSLISCGECQLEGSGKIARSLLLILRRGGPTEEKSQIRTDVRKVIYKYRIV